MSHLLHNCISPMYLLFRSHLFTDYFLILSCLLFHMLLISVSSYTHYTNRHTNNVILSHYTHFIMTLQILYFHPPPLSLSSCTINSFQFYNSHSSCRLAFELIKFEKISNMRFRTCIILKNSQEIIEDFSNTNFMVYRL